MPQPITARLTVAAPESSVGEFMFMPAGINVIHATQGSPGSKGREITAKVLVKRGDEAPLQQQLDAINARTAHKAYFDFNHEDRDASFWPQRFAWKDAPQPGIYVSGEWSDAGRNAIAGKVYRAFSPVFHVDDPRKDPCRIICQPEARLNMGGLVNDPAFRNNLPLWAKQAGATQHQTTTHQSHMTKEELAALHAKKQNLEQEIASLIAASNGAAEDAEAINAKRSDLAATQRDIEAEELKAKNATLEQALLAQRSKDAEAAVAAAVKRGAIAAKDTAKQDMWKRKCTEDVENITLLNGIAGSPALTQPTPMMAGSPRLNIQGFQVRASNENVITEMAGICARQRADVSYSEKPKIAKDLAALYAKEILPRLKEGDDIPLRADNSLGTLAQSLVATRTLELLTLTFPLLKSIMTDFSDQIVSYGDTLTSRYVGIPSVQTYNTSTGWPTNSDVTTTDVAITYNQYKGVPIIFRSHEVTGTIRRLFDEIAPAQAYALGKDIVDYVYALITAAYTNTVTAAGLGTFGRSTVIDIGGILDDAGVPDMGRFFLLARPYYSALSKDNTIVQLAAYQRAQVITERMNQSTMPDIEGFNVIKAVNLPTTSIAGKTLKGFAGSKSALALATRLSADYVNAIPGAGNGNLTVVTTPGGFSANLVQFVNHSTGAAQQRLEVIYGASRGQVAAGALLTDV